LSVYWLGRVITEDEKFKLPDWATVPLVLIAGGSVSRGIGSAMKKVLGKRAAGQIPQAAETLGTASIAFGATMLAKAVYYIYKKATDACTLKCRKIVKPGKNYPAQASVCFHQCKIQSLQGLINKLKSERSMCEQTQYPEKCVQNLNNQIIKYQTELEKEFYQLQKSKFMLFSRLRKIPVSMSSKPSTEKLLGKI